MSWRDVEPFVANRWCKPVIAWWQLCDKREAEIVASEEQNGQDDGVLCSFRRQKATMLLDFFAKIKDLWTKEYDIPATMIQDARRDSH